MKVALIGATGFVGKHIAKELISRGHNVLGIARHIPNDVVNENLNYISLDIENVSLLSQALINSDIVVSAFNAGWENPNIYDDFLKGSNAIQDAVKHAGIKRYLVIGGAGSLWVNKNTQVIDTPEFPKNIYPGANAARKYLELLKQETDLDWSYFSPAIEMHPGITTGRTGKYRLGNEEPVVDSNFRSILSVEDLAVVIADEVEQNRFSKKRFTAAY